MEPAIDIKDVQQLLGERDLIIYQLQKQVAALQADRERLLDERGVREGEARLAAVK